MNKVVVSLGSNIRPEENIRHARRILARKYDVIVESSFVITKPVGEVNQPDFINGAILLKTPLSMSELKGELKEIEVYLGRNLKSNKFGPRTIDLDIVVWKGKIVDQDFYERDYLRLSVLDVLPEIR